MSGRDYVHAVGEEVTRAQGDVHVLNELVEDFMDGDHDMKTWKKMVTALGGPATLDISGHGHMLRYLVIESLKTSNATSRLQEDLRAQKEMVERLTAAASVHSTPNGRQQHEHGPGCTGRRRVRKHRDHSLDHAESVAFSATVLDDADGDARAASPHRVGFV